jgi:hypothetical protein
MNDAQLQNVVVQLLLRNESIRSNKDVIFAAPARALFGVDHDWSFQI